MATEYKLSYTGSEIDAKLGKIDSLASKNDLEGKSDVNHMHSIESIEGLQETIDEVIANIPSVTDVETKMPIELAAFQYYKWDKLSGNTVEEKAQQLARYGIIVYQGSLAENLSMSGSEYERDLALYTKALEYNPSLKVFGYATARGFANSKNGGHVGMTEYRTSPENVDHPIWTKEELAAYINLMAHCGGTKDDSTTNEFGNPVLTGGIPLYGVFFDDWDYHFNDDNTHIMNQGDWSSIREKHNFLIDYCHSCGLHVMPNSNPALIFNNTETPNSIRNPDGIPSSMNADDWFCVESYFLRSDKTFSTTDSQVTTYNENYRETYKSKCLVLAYVNMVDDDSEDNEQIANTFALYQALCQGADSIALHGSNCITEIPAEFAKYYDKNNNAIYTSGTGYYKLTVNGHTVTATRNASATSYGQSPNAAALATCKIIIDDHNVFNNMCVRNEEMLYKFADVNKDIKELSAIAEQNSNLYHRALIDDWKKNYTLADYTNYSFTFQNAFGGEDTGATSSWNSSDPYSAMIYLPKQYSWRRVETNISHLAGKTVELGFENIDVYLSGSPTTKINGIVWEVIAVCDSGTVSIIKFNASTMQKSVIDGVSRCCAKFTFPEDVQTLRFWTQRQSATPAGTWVIDFDNSYLVDINEHPIQKTWFTNYAPQASTWDMMNSGYYSLTRGEDSLTVNYTKTTQCYETRMQFPANTAIFKPGETWELGFKDIKLTHLGTGADITSKLIILFNLPTLLPNFVISDKSYAAFLNMKSEISDDRISIARFTVPEDYAGGMSQTPMYIYTSGYVGGDSNGFYQLYIEGLYLYKLDERDELFIRGEDSSNTYIGINRVRTDTIDEKLKPDFLYVVDDGSMFITDFRGDRVDIGGTANSLISAHNTATDAHTDIRTALNNKLSSSELQTAINTSLAQAKASGEFDGATGKTAYAYAQEAGYTGTEEEFAEKLAQEPLVGSTSEITPAQVVDAISDRRNVSIYHIDSTFGAFYFTSFDYNSSSGWVFSSCIMGDGNMTAVVNLIGITDTDQWQFTVQQIPIMSDIPAPLIGTTDEVTPSQVSEAVEAGRDVSITYNDATYGAVVFSSFMKSQGFNGVFSSEILLYAGTYVLVELYGHTQRNNWTLLTTQLAQYSDVPTKTSQLTNDSGFLTAAPVTSVNGQTGAVQITIPTALKNPSALTINGVSYDGSETKDFTDAINTMIDSKLTSITNAEEVAF